jgi:hypothetical protein
MGLSACAIALLEFPLWMIHGSVPPFHEPIGFAAYVTKTQSFWLLRTLKDMVIFCLLVCFAAAYRKLLVDRDRESEWLATLYLVVTGIYPAPTLVVDSFNGSLALDASGGKADPVVLRTMVESTLLMLGPVGLILIGTMTLLAAILNHHTDVYPPRSPFSPSSSPSSTTPSCPRCSSAATRGSSTRRPASAPP